MITKVHVALVVLAVHATLGKVGNDARRAYLAPIAGGGHGDLCTSAWTTMATVTSNRWSCTVTAARPVAAAKNEGSTVREFSTNWESCETAEMVKPSGCACSAARTACDIASLIATAASASTAAAV